MSEWQDYKQKLLKNPKVKAEYDQLEPQFRLAEQLIRMRAEQDLTQAEVAKKAGVQQTVIARLESGEANPTLATMEKVAKALGRRISLV